MRIFLLWIALFCVFRTSAQELLQNGSFEVVDPSCFISQCLGEIGPCVYDWENAVGFPKVGLDPCFSCEGSISTPYGSHAVKLNPKFNTLPTSLLGDAIYQATTIYPGQTLDLTYSVHAFCNDWGVQSLYFLALEELPATIGSSSFVSLLGIDYVFIDSKEVLNFVPTTNGGFVDYAVTLDLSDPIFASSTNPDKSYNYFMILAVEKISMLGENAILLDNVSMQQCPSFENFILDYDIVQSGPDCGYTEFSLISENSIRYSSWDFGDGECGTSDDGKIDHIYNNAGTYKVTIHIVDANGCVKEIVKFIEVDCDRCPGFTVDFAWSVDQGSYNPLYILDPVTGELDFMGCEWDINFIDLSTPTTGNNLVSWNWDFGNGLFSLFQSPIVALSSNNSLNGVDHEVCLTVMDSFGCTETVCKTVNVNCRSTTENSPVLPEVEYRDDPAAEVEVASELAVYPSPFNSQLLIESPQPLSHVSIISATGQILLERSNLTDQQVVLSNLTGLTTGMYYLRLVDHHGNHTLKKVIKQ